MKLGSLFDGSGGFPLAASLSGIEPIWASEIEPFPIMVTRNRFPNMKHLGNVSNINGAEIDPVDIITFGSPCQDLSVAGRRSGLDGQRSGLFFEAVRIIKEMREATNGLYPTYMVWENVPGAFSSNGGADFQAVLETVCGIKEVVSIPRPKKWRYSGEILGSDWSVAWRTLDAQYWGVPQRRKRIFLVADFRGGVPEKYYLSPKACQGILRRSLNRGKKLPKLLRETLERQSQLKTIRMTVESDGGGTVSQTLPSRMGTGGNNQPLVAMRVRQGKEGGGKGVLLQENKSGTLACNNDQVLFVPYGNNSFGGFSETDTAQTLEAHGGNVGGVRRRFYSFQRSDQYAEQSVSHTLSARDYKSFTDIVLERK